MSDNASKLNMLPADVHRKLDACRRSIAALGKTAVAFSGGVDSTLLLALTVATLGRENTLAVIAVSPSLPRRERDEARALAERIGAELAEVETAELDDPNYAANPPQRCFYCKSEAFGRIKALAAERGIDHVVNGANADDTGDFRPGLRAARELDVAAPLMDAGLTKAEVRAVSEATDLPTWDKPAMACLASRIPYGQNITAERLARVERAEYALTDMGFREVRVRDHDTLARIELPADDLPRATAERDAIVAALKALGYAYVTLDLQGFRSGSMNETLSPGQRKP